MLRKYMASASFAAVVDEKHGKPTILEDVNVIIGLGAHQATNILSDELKVNEQTYLTQKYA